MFYAISTRKMSPFFLLIYYYYYYYYWYCLLALLFNFTYIG
uniref:Uncharacterized protein n=1 Tax=Stylosanthes hamata TaxID=37660 RepID=A7Y7E6_STYHA|nr:unknown [Stylosanthes hamata]